MRPRLALLPCVRLPPAQAVAVCLFCIFGLTLAYIEVRTSQLVAPQRRVIAYLAPWHPTQGVYHPGDEVFFTVDREGFLAPGERVGIKVTTSWQEVNGTLTYGTSEGAFAHHVRIPGRKLIETRRHLPDYILPNRNYVLVGITETVSDRAAPSVELFTSDPIRVLPNEDPPEP